jgi:hypothetical protein
MRHPREEKIPPEEQVPAPGEGYYFEDDPDKVQGYVRHAMGPLRAGKGDGVDYPDPGNIVDAHIGDSRGKGPTGGACPPARVNHADDRLRSA